MIYSHETTFQDFVNTLHESRVVKALELAASDYELRQCVQAYETIKKLRSFMQHHFPYVSEQSMRFSLVPFEIFLT